MPMTIAEMFDSRTWTRAKDRESCVLEFVGYGTDDDAEARAAFLVAVPATFTPHGNELVRIYFECWTQGGKFWRATARYAPDMAPLFPGVGTNGPPSFPIPPAPNLNQPLGANYSFDFTGVSEHVYQSKETISKTKRVILTEADPLGEVDPGPAPDCKGAIGVTGQGEVQGCERLSPNLEWSRTVTFESVTQLYIDTIAAKAGTTNNATFYGWPEGTQLFLGGTSNTDDTRRAKVTFKFLARANLQTVPICEGLTVQPPAGRDYAKGGHEFLWVSYGNEVSNGRSVQAPRHAYVEQIYEPSDFAELGIG